MTMINASKVKVIDESMCAYRPRTTATGGLPNISFIKQKPEPLGELFVVYFLVLPSLLLIILLFYVFFVSGTEFKVLAHPVTGCLMVLELQRGKAGMSTAQYQDSLGATAVCTVRLLETSIPEDDDRIHTVQGDAWFGSVRAAAALGEKGHRVVLQVKNNKGLFPKRGFDCYWLSILYLNNFVFCCYS
jgi:hypothetical protein